jgi:hypothetical protein
MITAYIQPKCVYYSSAARLLQKALGKIIAWDEVSDTKRREFFHNPVYLTH